MKWVKPLYDPEYDRLWKVIEDLEIPVNADGGTGVPDYGKYPTSMLLYIMEASFYSQRPFVQLVLSGVFDRFPRLKFVMTENGCAWLPGLIAHMDAMMKSIRSGGAVGEIRYTEDERQGSLLASEAFAQNCWMGVSQPGMADAKAMAFVGEDRFMWGSDYPHDEGTYPHSREAIRSRFHELAAGRDEQDPRRQRRRALRLRPRCPRAARRRGGVPRSRSSPNRSASCPRTPARASPAATRRATRATRSSPTTWTPPPSDDQPAAASAAVRRGRDRRPHRIVTTISNAVNASTIGPETAWTTSVDSVSTISTFTANSPRSATPHIAVICRITRRNSGASSQRASHSSSCRSSSWRDELADEQEHEGLADDQRHEEGDAEGRSEERLAEQRQLLAAGGERQRGAEEDARQDDDPDRVDATVPHVTPDEFTAGNAPLSTSVGTRATPSRWIITW